VAALVALNHALGAQPAAPAQVRVHGVCVCVCVSARVCHAWALCHCQHCAPRPCSTPVRQQPRTQRALCPAACTHHHPTSNSHTPHRCAPSSWT
jgi:hypothetical protein